MYAMGLLFMPCSMTSCTWIFDFFSTTVTDITGYLATHHTKRSLCIDVNDTRAMTASTSDWTCSWLSTRAITCTTACFTIVLNFFFSSKNSFFKGQVHTILEIIPLAWSVWITSRATAKEARKDIFEATKTRAIKATEAACTAAKATIGSL